MTTLNRKARKFIFRAINWISRTFFASRLSYSHIEAFIYYNSWKKILNLVHVKWDMWRGNEEVTSKPYIFILEPTNICNLKCPFCLTGKGISGGRQVRHMNFEEAKAVIDEVGEYVYFLQLYTWGEPLLNTDIFRIIAYASKKNIYVMLSTNATAMTAANNKALIESGVNYIMVAIDGGSNETYAKYRVGGNYDKVLANVTNLLQQKKEQGRSVPFVEWQYVVFRHNEHEVDATEKLAYDIGIDKFTPLPAYVEDPEWLPRGEKYKPELLNPERITNCDRPWSHLNLRSDGGVAPCCYEFFKKDDFANIYEHSFHNVWNNAKYQTARRLIYQKRQGKVLSKENIICYNCLRTETRPSYVPDSLSTEKQTKESSLDASTVKHHL